MGRRSNFKNKQPRDYWPTVDPAAVTTLIPFIKGKTFAEPCVGNGDLVDLLFVDAKCNWESDIEPQKKGVIQKDATDLTAEDLVDCDYIITNPPFSFEMLQPLLDYLPTLKPTWLLLNATFMQNKRSQPYIKKCSDIVSVGRLFWVTEGGDPKQRGIKGKEDYCWYLFHNKEQPHTVFHGRN